MASRIGMSYRNEAAQKRIDAALATLMTGAGIDLPQPPAPARDAILGETLRLEWTASVLEAFAGTATSDEPVNLMALTRTGLNAYAAEHGVPDAVTLPNKDAVIAALTGGDAEAGAP